MPHTSRPTIAIAVLLERQVSDWQQLIHELKVENADPISIAYCEAQIQRIEQQAARYANSNKVTEEPGRITLSAGYWVRWFQEYFMNLAKGEGRTRKV